jgi:hypothetical protein
VASVDVLQANTNGSKAAATKVRRVRLTLADRLEFGNLTINEVCALKNRSRTGFYEDVKNGLVSIEQIGDRKSIVRGPVARCYIEGRPIAEAASASFPEGASDCGGPGGASDSYLIWKGSRPGSERRPRWR